MQRFLWCVAIAALFCGGARGQSDPTPPVFEVADFRSRDADPFMSARAEGYMSGGMLPVGRYEMHRANLADLIQAAYGVRRQAHEKQLAEWLAQQHKVDPLHK